MAQTTPYLKFNGNCREAFTFYKEVFGGDLDLQAVGDTPMADKVPAERQAEILHASLTNGAVHLFGSDMGTAAVQVGNAIIISLNGETEEIKQMFNALSEGGQIGEPLAETFFGAFGSLTDKYGMPWMFQSQTDVAI